VDSRLRMFIVPLRDAPLTLVLVHPPGELSRRRGRYDGRYF